METARIRLADILSSMALAIDLGLGVPTQTVHRTTLIAVRLARAAGLDAAEIEAAYYLAILRFIGCSTTAHETSRHVDELSLGNLLAASDDEIAPEIARAFAAVMPEAEAAAMALQMAASLGSPQFAPHHRNHCEAAQLFAKRLGLGPVVVAGLAHVYERWDGVSTQRLAQGEAISLPMRVVHVAYQAGQDSINRGATEVEARVRRRAGSNFDPAIAALFAQDPAHFLAGLDETDLSQQVIDAEPGGPVWLEGDRIDLCLSAVADFGDFKSPHMLGHSRRVAAIAGAAAQAASMSAADIAQVTHAALIHDVGRIGVQSSLLSKPGTLSRAEHERIRLHSYLTDRIFAGSPMLAPIGALGCAHHERLDGSGYHRGLSATAISAKARLLAAANAWCALTEIRPHRQQMSDAVAASTLWSEAKAGLFDRRAVDAVLTVAGQKGARTRRAAGIGLSEREIEVLQHVAREETNAVIASSLGLSPKTVERHVTNIYNKLGISTRAGAAIYALESGLL